MRRPQASSAAFLGLTSLVILGTASVLAAAWPAARAGAKAEAAGLISRAASAPLSEAAADYHLATVLDRHNQSGYLGLARTYIATGQADKALASLEMAGDGSDAAQLRLRTMIELGRVDEAARRAQPLTEAGRSDHDKLLAGLTYALADRGEEIPALVPTAASPDTARRLTRIQTGGLPLATELFNAGLTKSSETVALRQTPSFERSLLLARIYSARHNPSDIEAATNYLRQAAEINPADIGVHQLLVSIYTDQHRTDQAAAEDVLVKRLQAGRP